MGTAVAHSRRRSRSVASVLSLVAVVLALAGIGAGTGGAAGPPATSRAHGGRGPAGSHDPRRGPATDASAVAPSSGRDSATAGRRPIVPIASAPSPAATSAVPDVAHHDADGIETPATTTRTTSSRGPPAGA